MSKRLRSQSSERIVLVSAPIPSLCRLSRGALLVPMSLVSPPFAMAVVPIGARAMDLNFTETLQGSAWPGGWSTQRPRLRELGPDQRHSSYPLCRIGSPAKEASRSIPSIANKKAPARRPELGPVLVWVWLRRFGAGLAQGVAP